MKYRYSYPTKIGVIGIAEEAKMITKIHFGEIIDPEYERKETKLIRLAYQQLEEYMQEKRREFDLPLNPIGTEFQKRVWEELRKIPYGQTITYKEIAQRIENPKACRAVGMANHNNPIAIIIPCHRVIGKNKKLVGYAGGIDIKGKLLNIEKEH